MTDGHSSFDTLWLSTKSYLLHLPNETVMSHYLDFGGLLYLKAEFKILEQ